MARRIVVGAAVVAMAVALFAAGVAVGARGHHAPAGPQVARLPSARVTVYGDSLVNQSTPYLNQIAKSFGLRPTVRAFYGTAPCDFLNDLHRDLSRRSVDVAVWAFSGNSIGTCMIGPDGHPFTGSAIIDKYRTDTQAAAKSAEGAGVQFVLVSPPAARSVGDWTAFDRMFRSLAATDPGIDYVDGGVEIAPDGHFRTTESCLPFEMQVPAARQLCSSSGDAIQVRASDGVHFCTVNKQVSCAVYSSGALRYALVILAAVRLKLDYQFETSTAPPPRQTTGTA